MKLTADQLKQAAELMQGIEIIDDAKGHVMIEIGTEEECQIDIPHDTLRREIRDYIEKKLKDMGVEIPEKKTMGMRGTS